MDGTKFKSVVKHYGEENILAILFDNSAVKVFAEGEFTMSGSYVDEIESVQFVEYDNRGVPYHTVKDVENIQGLIIRDSQFKFKDYDRVSIRG